MKLDALVIGAHPDDAEISVGGTILRMIDAGRTVGVLDLTRGEMGTRGTAEDRDRETQRASELLGLHYRGNVGLPDGRVEANVEAREAVARILRETQPDFVLAHHEHDLHPDHSACGRIAKEAWYLSGLKRLAELDGGPPAKRPARLAHFMGHIAFEPTVVVDVDAVWERKLEVIRAYTSQIQAAAPDDRGEHFLFGADILQRAETKARFFGEKIGVRYGEPLWQEGPLATTDPTR